MCVVATRPDRLNLPFQRCIWQMWWTPFWKGTEANVHEPQVHSARHVRFSSVSRHVLYSATCANTSSWSLLFGLGRTVLPNWLGLRSWLTAWAESKLAGQPRARSWVSTTTTWQVVCKKNRVYKFIQEHSGWIPLRKLEYGTSPALRNYSRLGSE